MSWCYLTRDPIAELDGAGHLTKQFVYGTRPDVPDYFVTYDTATGVPNGTYRIISDHLGSVRLVVDMSSGTTTQKIDYDEWGRPTLLAGTWEVQPFGFAGGIYDPDTGLVRFGARDYDAAIGRWTAKDPIGFGGGDGDLYGYVSSDPVNMIDPTGLDVTPVPTPSCTPAPHDCSRLRSQCQRQLLTDTKTCRIARIYCTATMYALCLNDFKDNPFRFIAPLLCEFVEGLNVRQEAKSARARLLERRYYAR